VVNITLWLQFTPQRKDPWYSLERKLGGPQEPVCTQKLEEESFASARDRTLVVHSVVRHYTD
jgi:hypothetical protein